MMMTLSRNEILAAQDLPREEVRVKEWGGTVIVRGLTGAERDAYEASLLQGRGVINYENARAKLLVRCLVDEQGERLFSDADVDILGAKSAAVLDRLFSVAARLSGLQPGDVEELMGNSGGGGGAGSRSPSRSGSA